MNRLPANVMIICLLAAAVGVSVYTVQAGPMAGVKDSAHQSVDAAEEAHDAVTKQAEGMETGAVEGESSDGATKLAQSDTMEDAMSDKPGESMHEHKMMVEKAVAVLMPTEGSKAHGTLMLTQKEGGVMVEATVMGLEPNSSHAIHIHQYGDVSSPDGKAAGGHYNPEGHDHALADTVKGHAGDFGNLESDENGTAKFSFMAEGISIAGMENPVLGRAIIVHAKADDGGQPTGNAGDRIAQGVIGIAE